MVSTSRIFTYRGWVWNALTAIGEGVLYIDYNTRMRTKANNDFEKDFYKLMNNSVFGKTMENIRNRQNVRLATTWEQVEKLINKLSFKRVEIFPDNLWAVHLNKDG